MLIPCRGATRTMIFPLPIRKYPLRRTQYQRINNARVSTAHHLVFIQKRTLLQSSQANNLCRGALLAI